MEANFISCSFKGIGSLLGEYYMTSLFSNAHGQITYSFASFFVVVIGSGGGGAFLCVHAFVNS